MSVFRGSAAFQWTDSDDQMTQRVLLLREPVRELRAAHTQSVFVSDSLDFSARQVFTVGEGADELVVRVRFSDDPQGLVDLLKAGTKLRTITYVPNLNDPAVKYDCYLISPLSPTALGSDPDTGVTFGDQEVELRLRQTNRQPFQGAFGNPVLFAFRAGGRMEEGTFSRAGVASYAANSDALGTLTTGASGAARLHWMSSASSVGPRRIPTLLLEEQRTNFVFPSENLASTLWVKNTVTVTSGQTDPRGGTAAFLVSDASTAAQGEITRLLTVTAGSGTTKRTLSWFLKQGTTNDTNGQTCILRSTNGAVNYVRWNLTWSSGKPTATTHTGTLLPVERWRGGYYRFAARSTGNLSTGNYRVHLFPAKGAGAGDVAAVGNVYAFGCQVE